MFEQIAFGACLQGGHLHIAVDALEPLLAGCGLGLADAGFGVQNLALQIGQVDRVVVNQRDVADTGRGQIQGRRRAEASGADDQRVGIEKGLLALYAQLVKQDMARIAQ